MNSTAVAFLLRLGILRSSSSCPKIRNVYNLTTKRSRSLSEKKKNRKRRVQTGVFIDRIRQDIIVYLIWDPIFCPTISRRVKLWFVGSRNHPIKDIEPPGEGPSVTFLYINPVPPLLITDTPPILCVNESYKYINTESLFGRLIYLQQVNYRVTPTRVTDY